ncbi:MAG: protease [Oxalobacter sp.]|nr:MAG: protease [Oxalobacter sp.]
MLFTTVGKTRPKLLWFGIFAFLALFFSYHPNSHAAPRITERTKQKQAAEAKRAELNKKLDSLKREISKTETAKGTAADTLAESEAAISHANRSLRELIAERQQTEKRLSQLSRDQSKLNQTLSAQKQRLAKLLREQYITASEDHIKLLMSGDNPNRITRELQYMAYVSQAQVKLIDELRTTLEAVQSNKEATQNVKEELEEIAAEKRSHRKHLEKEKARRAAVLSEISSKLAAQRKEANRLAHNQQRLTTLVDKLGKLIEAQRKAEAKKRRERLAKAKKARKPVKGRKPPVTPEEPPEEVDTYSAFAKLRGKMKLPVRGTITNRFGTKRSDGPRSKGIFIRAPEGTEVKSVAKGKVVFSDWLRGFGNLLIVDHGSQYMTIYGNNQTLFKQVGDSVNSGDVIAGAGNSGGNEHSGLYFEMRHRGRAFDPLGWATIR